MDGSGTVVMEFIRDQLPSGMENPDQERLVTALRSASKCEKGMST